MHKKQKNIEKTEKLNNIKVKFIIELILAILLTVACALIGMSNLLGISNNLYPYTADGMGHMTKVVYIADQLKQGHIPSWFPYWYNGSTVTQYYVPLSYYLMAPIYMITNNVMLTYKIFCAGVMAIGGFGVWTFCYKKIGRVCGLVGILVFCFQPVLLESLYREGVVAQGPIFAIMPWFLLLILTCTEKPDRKKFISVLLLTTLMILSHAMHAFMVCAITMFVLFLFVLIKKVKFTHFFIISIGILFAGLLTAFWSVTGSTKLENPTIPYLLPESAFRFTANFHWFIPNDEKGILYFSAAVSCISILTILLYLLNMLLKKNSNKQKFYGLACILLSIVTTVFSFGMNLPGYQYLPLASSMVPGRILTYTAVSGAITCAYGTYMLWNIPKLKYLFRAFALCIFAIMLYDLNPTKITYQGLSSNFIKEMGNSLDYDKAAFDKGRYQWYGPLDCQETFFPVQEQFNISNGWNMEGTVHNQVVYNNHIALPLKEYDYIKKQLAFWNIRYLLLNDEYQDLGLQLEKEMGYTLQKDNREAYTLYVSREPSSYYLIDSRNALVISNGMQGFSIQFPEFVQGKSANLTDYSQDELFKYKLIYIIEPSIKTQSQKDDFEAAVKILVNAGITVMIEPEASKIFDLFGVHVKDELINTSPVFTTTQESPINLVKAVIKNNSYLRMIRSLSGLDQVYANFSLENGNVNNAIIGTKKVGKGEVILIGSHLSQYLDSVYIRNNGINALNDTITDNSIIVETIFSEMFSYYGVNEKFLPDVFETINNHHWDYNGGMFTYTSTKAQEVTISVTYSPRWKATLDGKEIEVSQSENLITLKLAAGSHTVKLNYGMTVYGLIGYAVTVAGFVIFLLFILFWEWNMKIIKNVGNGLINYLQIGDLRGGTPVLEPVGISQLYAASAENLLHGASDDNAQTDKQTDNIEYARQNPDKEADEIERSESNVVSQIHQKSINKDGIHVDIIEIEEDDLEEQSSLSNEGNADNILEGNTIPFLFNINRDENEINDESDNNPEYEPEGRMNYELNENIEVEPGLVITENDYNVTKETNPEMENNADYDIYDEILRQAIIENEAKRSLNQNQDIKTDQDKVQIVNDKIKIENDRKHPIDFKQRIASSTASNHYSEKHSIQKYPQNINTKRKSSVDSSRQSNSLIEMKFFKELASSKNQKQRRNSEVSYSQNRIKKQYIPIKKSSDKSK